MSVLLEPRVWQCLKHSCSQRLKRKQGIETEQDYVVVEDVDQDYIVVEDVDLCKIRSERRSL